MSEELNSIAALEYVAFLIIAILIFCAWNFYKFRTSDYYKKYKNDKFFITRTHPESPIIFISLILVVVFYYIASPYQNCVREYDSSDWIGEFSINEYKKICRFEKSW